VRSTRSWHVRGQRTSFRTSSHKNSWLYFLKTIVILRKGDPDGGGGGGNHPIGSLTPRPLRYFEDCVRWRRDCVLRAPRLSPDCWRPQPLAQPLIWSSELHAVGRQIYATRRHGIRRGFLPSLPPYPPFSTARGVEEPRTPRTAACAILLSELRKTLNKQTKFIPHFPNCAASFKGGDDQQSSFRTSRIARPPSKGASPRSQASFKGLASKEMTNKNKNQVYPRDYKYLRGLHQRIKYIPETTSISADYTKESSISPRLQVSPRTTPKKYIPEITSADYTPRETRVYLHS